MLVCSLSIYPMYCIHFLDKTEVLCCYKKQQLEPDMEQQTGSK